MSNPSAIRQLQTALDQLASALESGRPEAVLAAELPLASAVGDLSTVDKHVLASDPDAPVALLELRLSVARCRAMGRASADLGALLFGHAAYSPTGARPVLPGRASTVASLT